jgi:ABC-type Mn2+/Zn2+ transport system permease subunit
MFAFLAYDFFLRALLAGVLVGFLAANLGVFVILRKMTFFSEAISHSSLTGIALGLLLGINPLLGAVGFSLLIALGIASLAKRRTVSLDTLIGVFFSTALALGVILIGKLQGYRVDLFGYLFGDILGVSRTDIYLILVLTVITTVLLFLFFRVWAKIAFHGDLASVEGIHVALHDRLFLCLLALVIALGIKLVGAVLIGPLVIIPAATAKNLSWNLRSVFVLSSVIGVGATLLGLLLSFYTSTASGPTIVLVSATAFGLSFLARSETVRT